MNLEVRKIFWRIVNNPSKKGYYKYIDEEIINNKVKWYKMQIEKLFISLYFADDSKIKKRNNDIWTEKYLDNPT